MANEHFDRLVLGLCVGLVNYRMKSLEPRHPRDARAASAERLAAGAR